MLSKRITISLLVCICVINACQVKTLPFKPGDQIRPDLFKNVISIWDDPSITRIDSVTIYQAAIYEELVDRDDIPEYKLINTESKESRANIVGQKNYHELYLFQLHTDNPQEVLCVFLASSFNTKGICTKLGPSYLGVIRDEQINMKKELKLSKENNNYFIIEGKPSKILFLANNNIPVATDQLCNVDDAAEIQCKIQIKEIINSNVNKIGGKKPVILNTEKIFNDTRALVFSYFGTIQP